MLLRCLVGISIIITAVLHSSISFANTEDSASGLSEAQKKSLKALDIKVAVPTYVPSGFKVSQVIAERCASNTPSRGNCREGSYYSIVYRNPTNTCLLINAMGGGVGGGDDEFQFSTKTRLLGEIMIGFNPIRGSGKTPTRQQLGKNPKPDQLKVPQQELSSFPAKSVEGRSTFYNAVSSGSQYYKDTYGCGKNDSITPLELEKVLHSLTWLK